MQGYRLTPRARRVLALLRRHRHLSRSDLIRATSLSGTAVFRASEELAAAGLVRTGETVVHGRGQPSAMIHIEPDAAFGLGLSVMTDRADLVLLDLSGAVRMRHEIHAVGMARDTILDRIAMLLSDHPHRDRIVGVGVAVAGFFVADGSINPGTGLDDWALIDLASLIGQRFTMPVMVENIANAAAVGERLLGVGAGYDSFCYVNVAAGFGAGIVIDGQLMRGRHGNAGDIAGLLPLAGLPIPNMDSLRTTLAGHGVETTGIADLVARFDPDWPGVDRWIADHGPSFARLFQLLRYMLDCEAIVLGGRLPRVMARRIVDATRWPEDDLPARRSVRAPATILDVAGVDPELAASAGAASLLLHRTLFD